MNKIVHVFAQWMENPKEGEELRIDTERLAQDVASAVEELNEERYEVLAVTPITSGGFTDTGDGMVGYSYTEAVLITARRME